MRRLYSVFFHCFGTIAPAASAEQVAENSFLLLCFALYFPLSFVAHFCERALLRDIGLWGIVGLTVGMGVTLSRVVGRGEVETHRGAVPGAAGA